MLGTMRISARQRRLEALAWAGGFFDGEGTTMARAETARPGYRRLNVSVPQSGAQEAPEVLHRFDAAVGGLGSISRSANGIYQWRSTDYVGSREVVDLLRPWIGPVKRRQAAAALAAVKAQYASGQRKARPGRYRSLQRSKPLGVAVHDAALRSRLERAWAAGFLDAEGCFGLARARDRVGGQPWYRIRASASQHGTIGVPAPVLRRLHRILGMGRIERHGEPDDFRWVVEGLPAIASVLGIVGPWLGTVKREQARTVMSAFTRQVRMKGDRTHCLRGHRYDRRITTSSGRTRAFCNACARLLQRRERARMGVSPRQFKDPTRRYTE